MPSYLPIGRIARRVQTLLTAFWTQFSAYRLVQNRRRFDCYLQHALSPLAVRARVVFAVVSIYDRQTKRRWAQSETVLNHVDLQRVKYKRLRQAKVINMPEKIFDDSGTVNPAL